MEVANAVQTILSLYCALMGFMALTWAIERRFVRRHRRA